MFGASDGSPQLVPSIAARMKPLAPCTLTSFATGSTEFGHVPPTQNVC